MPNPTNWLHRWEVRPTLRLLRPISDPMGQDKPVLDRMATTLLQHPNVEAVHVWMAQRPRSYGLGANIVFGQPSSPGTAVDEAITLLAVAAAEAGLPTDILIEVEVEMADEDVRAL